MKRIFESPGSLKIASVVIALALWIFVNSRGVSEITISAPLEIKNLAEDHEIVSQKTNEVNLGLKGHERLIKSIRIKDIRVYLDMSKMKDGWGVYYINKENIKVPPSIEVTKIDPSMVKIKVEKTVSKRIPVTASINGEPMDGYSVVSVVVEPPLVMVEGAESVVDRIKRLKSESIDISGKKETFEEVATVLTNGKIIRVSDDEVKVIVTIKREKK
jgi:YbbR domain-containing protein